jgi:hypothetical protein
MASKNKYFYKLLSWAALSLIALSAPSCSESASPFGQTEIAFTSNIAQIWGKYHKSPSIVRLFPKYHSTTKLVELL